MDNALDESILFANTLRITRYRTISPNAAATPEMAPDKEGAESRDNSIHCKLNQLFASGVPGLI
jgi:hypothetical protein